MNSKRPCDALIPGEENHGDDRSPPKKSASGTESARARTPFIQEYEAPGDAVVGAGGRLILERICLDDAAAV